MRVRIIKTENAYQVQEKKLVGWHTINRLFYNLVDAENFITYYKQPFKVVKEYNV